MEKTLKKIYKNKKFIKIIEDLLNNEKVKQMQNYKQHYETTCFNHCLMTSYYCYIICQKLKLDYNSCARAAMLHDLFLYDWRKRENNRKGLHALTHPKTALKNASELYELNNKEKDIILKHMWPVTFFSFPKYKESYILTLVDKFCAINESYQEIYNKCCQKKFFRYAYIFFSLIYIKF